VTELYNVDLFLCLS